MRLLFDTVGTIRDALLEFEEEKSAEVRALTARHSERLKQRLRQQVLAAGMGQRLANAAWQNKDYPGGKALHSPRARRTLSPAGYVYSKAPLIVSAFADGVTIQRPGGQWLAIPTGAVPKSGGRGGGKRKSPVDVEAHFNRELRVVRPRGSDGRYVLLVMDNVTRAKGRAGDRGQYRKLTKGRARQGRVAESVVMFILVPQVRLKKIFNLEVAARQAQEELAAALRARLE